jgi:hypothetical protein
MIAAARHKNFGPSGVGTAAPARAAGATKPGILRRIVNAICESRARQADREIANLLGRSGWRLTDDIEREMTQRLSSRNWSAPE